MRSPPKKQQAGAIYTPCEKSTNTQQQLVLPQYTE